MSNVAANPSTVDLSLQSLIDTRFDVQKLRVTNYTGGQDYPGQRLASRRGQGIEFLDLRQYTDGDDVRHIDWNVTARTNEPYTRLYRQEKEQVTTVIVDLRPVMFTGSDCLRAVTAGRLAAATLWQSATAGDRCAALVISDHAITASRPLPGNNGVLQALELIANGFRHSEKTVRDKKRLKYENTCISDALDIIVNNKRSTGRYLLFSSFDIEQDHRLSPELLAMAGLKRLNAILLLDKLEQGELPNGNYRYQFYNKTGKARINRSTRQQLIEKLHAQVRIKQHMLTNAGIDTITTVGSTASDEFLAKLQQRSWI